MKMAKANQADLDMAMELEGALSCLGQRWTPCMPEAIERLEGDREREDFDRDDDAQCGRAMRYLLDLVDRGSLGRVVWGLAVVLDPRNKLVDPEADTIEHHPERRQLAALQRDRERLDWIEGIAGQQRGKVELARSILGTGFEVGEWPSMRVTVQAGSLRAAIDQARGVQPELPMDPTTP